MSTSRLVLCALALVAACRPSTTPEPASGPTTYLLRLGADTLAVDQFTWSPTAIRGTVVTHLPRTVVTQYSVTLNPATGMASEISYNSRLADGSLLQVGNQPAVREITNTFVGDSVINRTQRDTAIVRRIAARRAFPYINYSMAFFQLPVHALRAANADSASYSIYSGGGATTPIVVSRTGDNSYSVSVGGFPYAVTTDGRGVIQSVDGARTTQHYVATRQGTLDIAALATRWAAAQGARPATTLSSRDTTRATIGGAELWVDYGRPLARGRNVWGSNGVLNDTIWRTGANAATQFRTNVPLSIGGQTVPAGTYTLWTLAVPGRYQLIINKQTGQWGTVYDPKQDLVRIPLQARSVSPEADQFTIAIEQAGAAAGTLKLRWTGRELFVPFTIP